MKPTTISIQSLDDLARRLRAAGTPFALATVVRTLDATAAKAGAKAILSAEGELLEGFLGGGCTRAALARAAKSATARNAPVLIALRPDDRLKAENAEPCELRDGMVYERNGCASKGSMDIFVEPFVPAPVLGVLGDGPVAQALRTLARGFDWSVRDALPESAPVGGLYIVVATQGRGDAEVLGRAMSAAPRYLGFVGSRHKAAALAKKLGHPGTPPIDAPAGLDIGAATAEEIALSILARIVQIRRQGPP